ncbi:MAG: hypothetical protein ACXVKI_05145 [Flavisolibacter sp.]
MMKKILSLALLTAILHFGAAAQKGGDSYKTALGMHIDFGSGGTWVGPAVKHFFDEKNAGEAQLLFASGAVVLGVEYQYNAAIQNAPGLKWYVGLGPAIAFGTGENSGTDLYFRPLVGLDYKINNVPLNFAFDWRPTFRATHSSDGGQFTAARFGLGFRYAF